MGRWVLDVNVRLSIMRVLIVLALVGLALSAPFAKKRLGGSNDRETDRRPDGNDRRPDGNDRRPDGEDRRPEMSGKPDFSGMDFSGMPDFSGMDFSGMDFKGRGFMKMIKFFMKLGHLSEHGGDFSGMPDLSGMDFSGMDFSGSGIPDRRPGGDDRRPGGGNRGPRGKSSKRTQNEIREELLSLLCQ